MKTINQYNLPEYFYKIAKYKSNDEVFLRIMIESRKLVMMSTGFIDIDTHIKYDPDLEPFDTYSLINDFNSSTKITNDKKFKEFYKECFDTVDGIDTFSSDKCYKAILKYFNIRDKYKKMIRDLDKEDFIRLKDKDYKLFNMIFVKHVKKLKKEYDPCIAEHLRIMASENLLSALQLARYYWLLKNGKLNGEE